MMEINSDDLASTCACKALTAKNTRRRVEADVDLAGYRLA
jgi:hypothetical protein